MIKSDILKIIQKYKNTCKIYYDDENDMLLWKGFFKRYCAVYTRSESHQQLKLTYGNIVMKITYIRLPDKPGIYKTSEIYKLPSFVTVNGNVFRLLDILNYSDEKELKYIEESIKNKLTENKSIDFSKINEGIGSLLKTILLAYSLFTKFMLFVEKQYKELYEIIINFTPTINKDDIKQFLLDSDELFTIEALTQALEEALKEEDYERATEIKRQIETIKNQGR